MPPRAYTSPFSGETFGAIDVGRSIHRLTDDDIPTLLEFSERATMFVYKTKITKKGNRLLEEFRGDRMNA